MNKNNFYTTNKHLTLEERELIEEYLRDFGNGFINFKVIAESLAKDPSTISKEIKLHRQKHKASGFNNITFNLCQNKFTCTKTNVCDTKCNLKCSQCEHCNQFCEDFKKMVCPKLSNPPYVCNNCNTRQSCKYEKYFYRAKTAHKDYLQLLKGSRKGLNMTYTELLNYRQIVKSGISKDQSLYHIKNSNPEIPFDVSSIYRHITKGVFDDINDIDLIRKVKLKPRVKTVTQARNESLRCKGRTFEDFLKFMEEYPFTPVLEMDTVIGKRDEEKTLLTMLHRDSYLFLAKLLPNKTNFAVIQAIDEICYHLGLELFKETFPVILTDNGSEFHNPELIEFDNEGNRRCYLFYCDPMRSGQKGMLEQTHTLLRRVLPKGTSFENLTQDKVTLIVNHINSYKRKIINGFTPFERSKVTIKKKVLEAFQLVEIPAQQVTLNPSLLKK